MIGFHKRTYFLLELLIALGLTAVLLSILFRFFAGSVRVDQKIGEARSILYQRQHFQTRISSVFNSIVPRSASTPTSGPSFYTVHEKSPSFVAVFDNGIDPDPQFSGPILGKIFLDADNLMLVLWPLEKTEKNVYRKEILISGVQNMRFQFLGKKSAHQGDLSAVSINSSLEWRTDWPKNRWDIPSIVRIVLSQDNQEISFAFILPLIEPIITYHDTGRVG